MPVILAFIIFLAAVPASAQHPSLVAGDWLRVDFRALIQGEVRTSEAPIRGEAGRADIAGRRVGIDGRIRSVDYQVEYEIGEHEWRDVYLDYKQFAAVQVRAGMFKLPFGLDENTSPRHLDFIYRAQISTRLAPGRDRGVSVHGRVLRNVVSYEAGVFGNDGDNARPSSSFRVFGRRTFAARLLARPFRASKSPLGSLQVGAAITESNVPLGYPAVRARTVFGGSFYDSDVWVQGRRQRTGLEVRWQPGRTSFQSEYIRLTDERRGQSVENADLSPLLAHGWYVSGTYRFTPKNSRFGRIEGAARYERMSFGSAGRAGEPSTSVRADAVLGNADRIATFGANWAVNRWVKVQANVIREDIGRPSMGPFPGRSSFWSKAVRLQLTL